MLLNLKLQILKKYPSQADFAKVVNLHESDLSRVIRGRKQLSNEDQLRWAKALNCKPDDIFKE